LNSAALRISTRNHPNGLDGSRSPVTAPLMATVYHNVVNPVLLLTCRIACGGGISNSLLSGIDQMRQMLEFIAEKSDATTREGPCRRGNEPLLLGVEFQAHHLPPIAPVNRFQNNIHLRAL
jgi:hypothetical protein